MGFFREVWQTRRWLAIGLALFLVLVLGGGSVWLAAGRSPSTKSSDDVERQSGGGGDTGANAALPGGGGGGIPDESSYDEVLKLASDTSGGSGAVNTFWSTVYPQAFRKPYQPPRLLPPYVDGQVPNSACSKNLTPAKAAGNAFYCDDDHSVAYSDTMLRKMYERFGDFSPVFILFHEYGHGVDWQSGHQSKYQIKRELRADCYGGMATRGAMQAGVLHIDDIREAADTVYSFGTRGGRWWDQDDHGTPEQRRAAFFTGYNGSVQDCLNIVNTSPGYAVQVPPFEVYVVNGSRGDRLQSGSFRLLPPDTTVKVDLRGYQAGQLLGTGDAEQQYNTIYQQWFPESRVVMLGRMTEASVELPNGQTAAVPINKEIFVYGSVYAARYDQLIDSGPVHGVMLLQLAYNRQGETIGALVVDVYDTGNSSLGWDEVDKQLLVILAGMHLKG